MRQEKKKKPTPGNTFNNQINVKHIFALVMGKKYGFSKVRESEFSDSDIRNPTFIVSRDFFLSIFEIVILYSWIHFSQNYYYYLIW